MEKLTFARLRKMARNLKELGTSRKERRIFFDGIIWGAKYYYVEQG